MIKRNLANVGIVVAAVSVFGSLLALPVSAQGMMGWNGGYAAPQAVTSADQTAQDEAAGQAVYDRLRSGQAKCTDLKDEDFDVLGDYYMGLMMGASHAAMNQALTARLGADGETQVHVSMGKRLSGCDPKAALPAGYGYMPMMGGYGGSAPVGYGYGNAGPRMMGARWYGAYGPTMMAGRIAIGNSDLGYWISMGLVWILLGLGIFALAKWILKRS